MADSDPDVRWMSYAEAARTLRVTPESLHRRMRRNGWARREGNDGKPRVAVPLDVLRRFDPVPDIVSDDAPDLEGGVLDNVPDERERTIRALEGEAVALRDSLARERARADEAEADAAAARREAKALAVRVAVAETEARAQRERAERAELPFWRRWRGR